MCKFLFVFFQAIFETSGRTYKVGSTKDLMYYAAGTSIDWSYGKLDIPYSYMVELRDKKNRFLLPPHDILDTAVEIYNGIVELMRFVDKKSEGTLQILCQHQITVSLILNDKPNFS